jgi:hypothetical protein
MPLWSTTRRTTRPIWLPLRKAGVRSHEGARSRQERHGSVQIFVLVDSVIALDHAEYLGNDNVFSPIQEYVRNEWHIK